MNLAPTLLVASLALIVTGIFWGLSRSGEAGPSSATGPPDIGPAASAIWTTPPDTAVLVDRWVGMPRPVASLETPPTRAVLDIQGAQLRFGAGPGQPARLFESAVVGRPPDILELTSTVSDGGCRPFDAGTYRWSMATAGTWLLLEPVEDDCGARAAALTGMWTHTACRAAGEDCLGPVGAGTYASTEFDAFGTGESGQLALTLPDGWANSLDRQTNYFLRLADEYLADPAADGNDNVHGIYLWAGTLATDQPDDCAAVELTSVPRDAQAIAAHLLSLPGLVASDRGTIEIGARGARVIDVAIDPQWSAVCPFSGGQPFRSLIMFADAGSEGGVWGSLPGYRQRVVLVDVAPGRVVSIWMEATSARFGELVEQAMPIVESMRFGPVTAARPSFGAVP